MSDYQHFKLQFTTNSGYFNPSEITLYTGVLADTAFTPFAGATYQASSVYYNDNPNYGPQNAFDGNPSTSHHSNILSPSIHWLSINLGNGNVSELTGISLIHRADTHYPSSVSAYGSMDGTSWTLINTIGFPRWATVYDGLVFKLQIDDADPSPFVALWRDAWDGGNYRIIGTVTELGVVGAYRVGLFDRFSAKCIRETFSAIDGSYSFNNLAYRQNGYFAIALDHGDNPLNAAIADLITPEPMP